MKSYLGDAVMAEPTLRAVQPHELFVLTSPTARAVLAHLRMDKVHPMGPRRNLASLRADVRALRNWRPDVAVVINRSFRAALSARLARVSMRVGHAADARDALLTHALPYDEGGYEAACYADLAEAAGLPVADVAPRLPAEPRRWPYGAVGIQPGARYAAKRLPDGAVRDLIAELEGQGRHVVLLGGPEEREDCERMATSSCTLLAGECSIAQTLEALAGLSAFVSADTGLGHLAFGVRTPSLAVFGPTRAEKWTHGPPQTVLRAPEGDLSRLSSEALLSAFCSLGSDSVPARTR